MEGAYFTIQLQREKRRFSLEYPGRICWRIIKALVLLCLCLVIISPAFASAKDSRDITAQCKFRLPGTKKSLEKMTDNNYNTYWSRYDKRMYEIVITLPEGVFEGGVYLRFFAEPEKLVALNENGEIYRDEGLGFAHRYVPFTSEGLVTLQLHGTKKGFSLSELSVIAGSEPPEWVQIWQPGHQKADLMVLVAHPDDEFLWTGGAIPYYALERDKKVTVCYMTCANGLRRSEMLNALWIAGVRNYPEIGAFRDRTAPGMKGSLKMWGGEDKVEGFIAGLFRKLKPEVVVTHDLAGEYGHLAHIITAKMAVKALDSAADGSRFSESRDKYGTWAVPKMYIHLLKDSPITMQWDTPITTREGKTAMEVGDLAFKAYVSQQRNFALQPDGPHSPKYFGLYRSLVGPDIEKNDFFESITEVAPK